MVECREAWFPFSSSVSPLYEFLMSEIPVTELCAVWVCSFLMSARVSAIKHLACDLVKCEMDYVTV